MKVPMDDSLRCPNCHEVIHEDDTSCPRCKQKLKFQDRLSVADKRGFGELALVSFGTAFFLVPFVSFVMDVLGLVLAFIDKGDSRYRKDAILIGIISIVIEIGLLIISIITMIQNKTTI